MIFTGLLQNISSFVEVAGASRKQAPSRRPRYRLLATSLCVLGEGTIKEMMIKKKEKRKHLVFTLGGWS